MRIIKMPNENDVIEELIENLDRLIVFIEEDVEGKYFQIAELVEELKAELKEVLED